MSEPLACSSGCVKLQASIGRRLLTMKDSSLDQFDLRVARPDEFEMLVRLDDEAGVLFERIGMTFAFPGDHPFVVAEHARWRAALACEKGRVIALPQGELAAFAIFGEVEGLSYLDQLSVRPIRQRRGLGSALVAECVRWASGRDVWLTTYAHVPWNAPYYRRLGCARSRLRSPHLDFSRSFELSVRSCLTLSNASPWCGRQRSTSGVLKPATNLVE